MPANAARDAARVVTTMNKPSALEVIGNYVELRRTGKEFIGRCPFHADKNPSFAVNEEKEVFYCHGCHESGDVIDFIQKIDGLTFPEALQSLGIETTSKRLAPPLTARRKRGAELAVAWAMNQRAKLNLMIAESYEKRDSADEAGAFDLAEIFDREIIFLRGFYDALEYPSGVAEMLALRPAIEALTNDAAVAL
jgi:hypothetical protein